ncbi:MAG TPA: rhamnulokinase family protein [Candidatus Sulfotelmatobacter sp.]|nr:rhamnulokinase family protein [Candidatus Sulfotelmatobacter sp.]
MNSKKISLAIDLGAGSGRVVAGIWDGARLQMDELNRFPNEPVKAPDGLHWDLDRLFDHVKKCIALAVRKYGGSVISAGVDTWGVDYGLLDSRGKIIGAPFIYRDARTNGMQEKAFARMPREEIYRRTGIQFMFFNTLFQLLADPNLERADHLLFMPDLLHYLLSGICVNEHTIAGTGQLLDPHTRGWERGIIRAMNFPEKPFGRLMDAGTVLGPVLPAIAADTGARNLQIIAPAAHDTASAVIGVPAIEPEPVFLSSGTWSLMGRELNRPVISEESLAAAFSNEIGAFGTTRFLKNIAGMWLLQECKRAWDGAGQSFTYNDLAGQAEQSAPFATLIDPDISDFQAPSDMPQAIADACRRTGQPVPQTPGAFTRAIFESLALKYRLVKESLARVTNKPIDRIYIVGGGCRNQLLNQFAADALNCEVVCEPVEATCVGNIIMQLHALGEIASLSEGRAVVRRSFETKTCTPQNTRAWNDAFTRFQKILSR